MKNHNINDAYIICDSIDEKRHNFAIYETITNLLNDEIEGEDFNKPLKRVIAISELVKYITDFKLLFSTIGYLKKIGFFKSLNQSTIDWQNSLLYKSLYSIDQLTRIDALLYGTILEYETLMINNYSIVKENVPTLNFRILGDILYNNLDEIERNIKKKNILRMDRQIKTYPSIIQEKMYSEIINKLNIIDYESDDNYYEKEIKFLSNSKQAIYELEKLHCKIVIEDSPFTSKEAFDFFQIYSKRHIIEPYIDFSYLFQRMLADELIIYRLPHLTFMNWLFTSKNIGRKTYDTLLFNSFFRSLKKSHSNDRVNNYNNLFKDIFTS